jgi:hypothetical protein
MLVSAEIPLQFDLDIARDSSTYAKEWKGVSELKFG